MLPQVWSIIRPKLRYLVALGGQALKTFELLRVASTEGKSLCPNEGCATSVKVCDGAQHQKSNYDHPGRPNFQLPNDTRSSTVGMYEDDSAVHEELSALDKRWLEHRARMVRELLLPGSAQPLDSGRSAYFASLLRNVHARRVSLKTTKGVDAVGAPTPGGFFGYEKNLLPYMLEEIEVGDSGAKAVALFRSHCEVGRRTVVFAPHAARADEQYNGDHLKRSAKYTESNKLKCNFASESLVGPFSTFFLQSPELQDIAQNLQAVSDDSLRTIWHSFVNHLQTCQDSEVCGLDGKATSPSTLSPSAQTPSALRHSARKSPSKKPKKLPQEPTGAQRLAFFHVMISRLFECDAEDGSDHPNLMKQGRVSDFGPFKALCACGLVITQAHKHVGWHECRVEPGDTCFGVTNHWTNNIVYDNNCLNGFAGHLPHRFPMFLKQLGGPERMGAAVPRSEVQRWFCERHKQRPQVLPWLGDLHMGAQTGNRSASINFRLNVVVVLHMFYPVFSRGNVQSGRLELFLSIDPVHGTSSQHPLIDCGCFGRRMLRGAHQSLLADSFKDFSAAERAWVESRMANALLNQVGPGMKLVWQHVLDQERCRRKIYAKSDGGGVLADRLLVAAGMKDTLPAYDSIARFRYACVECESLITQACVTE